MIGAAAIMTVLLSMPGIPHKEYRAVFPDPAQCAARSADIQTEIYRYAFLKGIPRHAVKLKIECAHTIAV